MTETERLTSRIKEIDRRLAEIEAALIHEPEHGSYKAQELRAEQSELSSHRAVADRRLRELAAPPKPPDPKRQALIENEIKSRREVRQHFITRLEAEGDHRQARIHRMALLDLRAEVEREFGVAR